MQSGEKEMVLGETRYRGYKKRWKDKNDVCGAYEKVVKIVGNIRDWIWLILENDWE